jgi:hypothetical protein
MEGNSRTQVNLIRIPVGANIPSQTPKFDSPMFLHMRQYVPRNLSNIYQITRCHKPEDHTVNSHCRKNKKISYNYTSKISGPKTIISKYLFMPCNCL